MPGANLFSARSFQLLQRTVSIGLASAALSTVLAVPLAFLLARTKIPGRSLFLAVYLVPLIIPPYIHAITWLQILGKGGWLDLLWQKIIAGRPCPVSLGGTTGTILVLSLSYFPIVTLLTISGLAAVDRRLEDAGRLVKPEAKVLGRISWPLVRPYTFAGFAFTFIFSIANYGVPALLGVNTYPIEIFVRFSIFYDTRGAALLSLPLLGLTILVLLAQRAWMGTRPYIAITGRRREPPPLELRGWRTAASIYAACLIFLSAILPIAALIIKAGSPLSYWTALKTTYGTIGFTLLISVVGATLMVSLSIPLAYFLARNRAAPSRALDFLTFLPFTIPPTLYGIGLIRLWNHPLTAFVYSSALIILLGFIARFAAFSIRVSFASFTQVDRSLEEASLLMPVTGCKRWCIILLPMIKPGLYAAWVLAFILCMGELGTTLLVIPAGRETLTLRIYNLMHYGAERLVAAQCIFLICIILVPAALAFRAYGKALERPAQK